MSDKPKPTEEELQQWLDSVHFGSCCSDLVEDKQIKECKNTTPKKAVD